MTERQEAAGPRVGLVLGAGGVIGGAWLTGGLQALAEETGWDAASADYIVGTSAGSMIGALCASGVPPWFMVAHSGGETFDGLFDTNGRPAAEADRSAGAVFNLEKAPPPIGPGSWKLALKSLSNPRGHTPGAVLSGWLPRGFISTEPPKRTIRRVVPHGWCDHRGLWVMACDYASGRRVAFGSERSPHQDVDLADAVAASCAIPGFYYPVTIDGRRYVDGGMHSPSNLDVLRHKGLDLVICMNPTSSLHSIPRKHPVERLHAFMRSASGRRLATEKKRLEDEGTKVVLVQPTAADLDVMGGNLMSTKRRHEVLELATRTVAEQLRRPAVQRALAGLPPGDPDRISKPAGPPSTWPRPKWVAERETSAA